MLASETSATLPQTKLITIALQKKIIGCFDILVENANNLFATDHYFATQEAIITAPTDLGIVRAVAVAHHQRVFSDGYQYAKKHNEPLDNIEVFIPSDAVVTLTIHVPLFGNIQATARVNPKSGGVTPDVVKINFDGSIGPLWFKSAMDILDKVQAANLLSAPTYTEVLTV